MAGGEFWSYQQKFLLEKFIINNESVVDIARRLGRSTASVYLKCSELGLSLKKRTKSYHYRIVPERIKILPCLKCHDDFTSKGVGNRICPTCAQTNQGYLGVVYD